MQAFLTIALIHLLAVASPGPDFAIMFKQSLSQPRRVVYWTALGIALGILVHVAYSLIGIGFIISRSILLFSAIKLLGAGYLLFVGWKAIRTKASSIETQTECARRMSAWSALWMGFLCNALNPKATLFFLALFTQVISPATPVGMQLLYGAYLSLATFVWFCGLGSILTLPLFRSRLHSIHLWVEAVQRSLSNNEDE